MKRLFFATALALLAPAVHAEEVVLTPAEAKAQLPWLYEGSDLPVDSSWTFGVLPNGLKYAVKHNQVPQGQVSIRVRIDAGSLHEEDSEQGFAHLIEHLSFRGSEYVPDGESKRIWQRLGIVMGSDSNAQTTPTQTTYKLDLPASNPTTLDESMKIIAGMMRAPNISESALNAERGIVLAEMRENSGAQMEFSDRMREHLFQGQRLAARSTIGTPETLQAASAPALRAFHDRWYRPDKAVVVIAGDADPAALTALVQKHFGDWTAEGPPAAQPEFGDPKADGKVAASMFESSLPPEARLVFVRPWRQVNDTVKYNQNIIVESLATYIINRRLENQARTSTSFSFAQVGSEKVSRSADMTTVFVKPFGGNWEQAVLDVRAIIADSLATPPTQGDIDREVKELQRAINTRLENYPFEGASAQSENIVGAVDIRETVVAPKTVSEIFTATLPLFRPNELFAATKRIFAADAKRIMITAPAPFADADTRMSLALSRTVAPAKKVRLAKDSLGFDKLPKLGAPGKVVSTQKHERFDMESVELSNGTRVLLWPNDAENDQVRVLVRFGRGYQGVAPADGGLLWSGPMVLGENGIGKLTRTQLDQLTNGRRIELTFNVDRDAFEFSATTRPQDMADQLTLIATKLSNPGWQSAPVERAKALAASDYDSFEMSAMAKMQRDLQYLTSGKDARWKIPTPAEVKLLTPKSFQAYWAPLLASGPVEVMLFGDFKREDAIAALEKSFGAMKRRTAALVPAGADVTSFPAGGATIRLTHKGPKDQAAAVVAWPTGGGLAGISEGRELEVLAAIFRDRLFEKFRSEQAASYSPDMQNNWPDEFRGGGYMMAYAQVQPQDVERFYTFAAEVAADLKANPVSADELQRAVEPLKQYVDRASTGNLFWMNQLEGVTYTPQRFSALGRLYADYIRVTPARVQELAKRYFRDDRAWKLVVEPEGSAAQPVPG